MLGPSGMSHIGIPASLTEVWNHTLELSISSEEVQHLLLSVQIVGVIGIQIHIEVSHKDRGISIGWILVLIKSSLDIGMEVIQALLAWG